jgi:hypothetical protein
MQYGCKYFGARGINPGLQKSDRILGQKPRPTATALDLVCQTYFVKQSDIDGEVVTK